MYRSSHELAWYYSTVYSAPGFQARHPYYGPRMPPPGAQRPFHQQPAPVPGPQQPGGPIGSQMRMPQPQASYSPMYRDSK